VLLHTKGDYAAAEPLYREALAMRRKLLGDEHPDVARSLDNLATLLREKGDYAAAEPLYREALEIRRAKLPVGHPDTIAAEAGLGRTLAKLGRYAEAEGFLQDAYGAISRAKNSPLLPPHNRIRILQFLIELYEAWHAAEPGKGYDKKAAEWRTKLAEFEATTQPASAPFSDEDVEQPTTEPAS
jgi:tetratricopeptide (TPR) repeat protein